MITNIGGIDVFYESCGEGPAVLFLHGLGGTSNIWGAQRAVLSKYFKVVTVDLPGSGRSAKIEKSYSMLRWVEQIKALADSAKLEKFTLVGHSMSTILAQNFAAKYGDRLDALVLCGPLTELNQAGRDAFAERAELVDEEGMTAVADKVLQGALTAATREGNPALAGLVREMLLSHCRACYAKHCVALIEGSAKNDQSQIKVPTLILVGDQDTVTPLSTCRQIAAAIEKAQIRIVPNTAHLTMLENPSAFHAAFIEFMATLSF